jgi:hypothetical protein
VAVTALAEAAVVSVTAAAYTAVAGAAMAGAAMAGPEEGVEGWLAVDSWRLAVPSMTDDR